MTRRDLIIIGVIFIASSVIGGAITAYCMHKAAVISLPDESKYLNKIDSIKVVNKRNKDTVMVFKKHIKLMDSLSLVNFKKINHDKKAINSFTPEFTKHCLDSIFKSAGV